MKKIKFKKLSALLFSFLTLSATFPVSAQFIEQPPENPVGTNTTPIVNQALDVVSTLLVFLFVVSIFGLIIASIKFIAAGGSEGSLAAGRKLLLASVIGLTLALIGYIVVNTIKYFT